MKKLVTEKGELLTTLQKLFPEFSSKKIKNYLKGGSIVVNHQITTKYNDIVYPQDEIEIVKANKTHKFCPLPIIFENEDFLVVDKPSGLLSIATSKEKEKTAYHYVREFVKKRNSHEKLFILHRLDKDTSGVLVFVKNEKLKLALQNDWNKFIQTRQYHAIIYGQIENIQRYVCYLQEDKNYQVKVVPHGGKKAITSIETIKSNQQYSLVKVTIDTGRKNQIRVVLSHLQHPIVGDKKYSICSKKVKRMYLHASKLVLIHPFDHKIYTFESSIPSHFSEFIKEKK